MFDFFDRHSKQDVSEYLPSQDDATSETSSPELSVGRTADGRISIHIYSESGNTTLTLSDEYTGVLIRLLQAARVTEES